jgi:hypothetical protein
MQRAAWQRSAIQSNADRPLATVGFPGRFGPIAGYGNAMQGAANQSKSKQRGSELGNRLFSGPLWSKCSASHGMAWRCKAKRISATQSNADRPLATAGFPGRFGPSATQGKAGHSKAAQSISKQRGSSTGNSGFSGPLWLTRPGFLGRFIN